MSEINGQSGTSSQGQQSEHVDAILKELASLGASPIPPEFQERIAHFAVHLSECVHCQITLEAVLTELVARAGEGTERQREGASLLARLKAVTLRARVRQQLPAYAELSATDEAAAQAQFPDIASHLATCEVCRREVDQRVATLRGQRSSPQE